LNAEIDVIHDKMIQRESNINDKIQQLIVNKNASIHELLNREKQDKDLHGSITDLDNHADSFSGLIQNDFIKNTGNNSFAKEVKNNENNTSKFKKNSTNKSYKSKLNDGSKKSIKNVE